MRPSIMMNNIIAAITTGDISGSGKSQTVKEGQGNGASLSAEASGSQSDNFVSMLSLLGAIVSGADNSSTTSSTPAPVSSKQEAPSKHSASDDSQLMSIMAGLMGVITPQQAITQKTSFQQTAGMDCTAETPSDKGAIPVTASSQPIPDTTGSATGAAAATAVLPGADKSGIPVTAPSQPLPDTTGSVTGATAATAVLPGADKLGIPVTASSQPLPDTTGSVTGATAAIAMLPGTDKHGIPVTASPQPLPDTTGSAAATAVLPGADKPGIPVTASPQPLPDTTGSATGATAATAVLPGADKLGIPVTASSQPLPDTTGSASATAGNTTAGTAPVEPSDDSLTHLPTTAHTTTSEKTASTGSLQATMDPNAQGAENPASQSIIQTAGAVPAEPTKDTSLQQDNIAAATVSGQSEKSGRSNELVGAKPDAAGHSQGNIPGLSTAVAVNSVAAVNKEAGNTNSGHDGQDLSQSDFTAMLKPGEKESEKIQSTDSSSNTSIVHIWGDNSSSKLSATTTIAKETSAVPQTFQNDVVQQITQKAIPGLQAGQSHIQIDLKPESLGALRLHISTDQQQVTVKILADNAQVKDMIERQIPIIKSELQHSGIKVDSVDVGMMSNGSDFASSQHESSAFNQAPSSSGHILHQENTGTDEAPPERRQHQNYIREGSQISYFA